MKEMTKQKSIWLINPDKKIQVNYLWSPSLGPSECTLLVLPGLDESIGDYHGFITRLIELFPHYSILAIDLRGQGATLDAEIKISGYNVPMKNQITIIKEITNSLQIKSLFVVGLSYGAGVALCAANQLVNIAGLALIATYVSKFKNFKRGLIGMWYTLINLNPFNKTMANYFLPLYFHMARDKGLLNPKVTWSRNKLEALTKLSTGILDISTDKESKLAHTLCLGVHLFIGEEDQVVSVSAVQQLFNELSCENKSMTIVPNLDHRLLVNNYNSCCEWMAKVLPNKVDLDLKSDLDGISKVV